MFSARTRFDLHPNRLARALDERRASGQPVLDLTLSNPTAADLPCPDDLLRPLAGPAAHRYLPSPRGLPAARHAVAEDFAARW